jgi:chromate reductase
MTTIIGISGSLRKPSYNSGLLRAAVETAPEDCTVDVVSIRGIPLYDGDVEETKGIPEIVEGIKGRIEKADALLLVTPEYNNSVPGVSSRILLIGYPGHHKIETEYLETNLWVLWVQVLVL